MKSELKIKEDNSTETKFPAFYRQKQSGAELVVLFMHHCCGVAVTNSNTGFKVGHWSVTWHPCSDVEYWERLGDGTEVTLVQG